MINYLMRYGYMPQVDLSLPFLRSQDELRSAIKSMQAYSGLPATGRVDRATEALLHRPRCGQPDVDPGQHHPSRAKRHHHGEQALQALQGRRRGRRYAVTANKWPSTNVTWSLQTHLPPGLDRERVRRELHAALNVWSSVSNLTFREKRSDAEIEVSFKRLAHNDGFDFDGRGNILAHAFFPGNGISGDVHFDEDEMWFMLDDPSAEGGISLFAVAAHEFGHSLGLSHSSVPGALMTPHYQELPRDFKLPEDDMHGIMQIYGSKGRLWDRIPEYKPDLTPREPAHPGYPGHPGHPGRPAPAPPRIAPTTTAATPLAPGRPGKHPEKPDTCNTAYDAVAVIRREVFIFKDKYLWRIGDKGPEQGYPAAIKLLWNGLPENFTRVDAVYERNDRKIVFFIGKEYYVYSANKLVEGFPKPLTHLGLPSTLTHIDDAMVWGYNGRTYLFSGSMYWRLDEEVGKIELDYPRDMAMWRGVGYNIDAVAQLNGVTYFFKGKGYWRFNDMQMRVEHRLPKPSASFLMGCPEPKGRWFDWEENSIDIFNDIESSFTSQHLDYDDEYDDDSGASQITSTFSVLCLCLLFSSYLTL